MEERDWWMDSENIVIAAEYLVFTGGTGAQVLDLFQKPWEFSWEYEQACEWMASFVDSIVDKT